MKLKLASLVLAMAVSSAAMARDHHHHHHNRDWVGPVIGGIIIGGVLSQANRPVVIQPPVEYRTYPAPIGFPVPMPVPVPVPTACRNVIILEVINGYEIRTPHTICN